MTKLGCSLPKRMLKTEAMNRDLQVDQIKKLWTLDLIVSTGSLKRAALKARVSPSAVSQTLASLERIYGKPLIIRNRGSVTPTEDALHLLRAVRPAFEIFERLKDGSAPKPPALAWLNFGAVESVAIDILPGLLHRLRVQLPRLRLCLKISRVSQLLTMVRKGELCSALITETDQIDRFYVKEAGRDRLGVYISGRNSSSLRGWEAVERSGLGVLAAGREGHPSYMARFLRQIGSPSPTVTSDSYETLAAACTAGSIAAVLPTRVAARSSGLVEITPVSIQEKDRGVHRICVVSLANCDPEETDFLAHEIKTLLEA